MGAQLAALALERCGNNLTRENLLKQVQGLKDVDAAIRYAINHPYNSEPLYAKLRPGMKVTIAIDDISLPLPPMASITWWRSAPSCCTRMVASARAAWEASLAGLGAGGAAAAARRRSRILRIRSAEA